MKFFWFIICFGLLGLAEAKAQYVPKEKRDSTKTKPVADTTRRATTTSPTNTNTTPPKTKEKKERDPDEKRFIGYFIAFPTFAPNSFSLNGGTGSFNVGYKIHERFYAGILTGYGYRYFPNVTLSGGSFAGNLSIQNFDLGGFGQINITDNYFLWAEYANLNVRYTVQDPVTQQKEIVTQNFAQPLFGGGAKYEFGSGNQGVATMLLFNPKYGDPYSPYPSIFVTRILYYFRF